MANVFDGFDEPTNFKEVAETFGSRFKGANCLIADEQQAFITFQGVTYQISDNGGEISIHAPNIPNYEYMSIPTYYFKQALHPIVCAERLRLHFLGEVIPWDNTQLGIDEYDVINI